MTSVDYEKEGVTVWLNTFKIIMRSCELTKVSLNTDVDERCRRCIPYNNDDNTRQLF